MPRWLTARILRTRAEYDQRVTLPIDALPIDVKTFFSGKHKWALAFQYYRCTGGVWIKAPDFENKPNRRNWIFTGFDCDPSIETLALSAARSGDGSLKTASG